MKTQRLERLKKLKRVAAWIGIVLLVGMYVVSLISALCKSESAHSLFITSLYCSIVVPVVIYALQMIYRLAERKQDSVDSNVSETDKK